MMRACVHHDVASSLSTRLKLMVLFKVTASKLSLPKVETMRKSYYLNDNIFKVKSVQEKLSNISLYIRNDYIKMKKKPYLETVTSKLV